ncbi:MAG TPA: aminotransferase class III-fold pyridoxal phosphate-dependent enzyme [Anaerolineae bacterium]|nr:aminotransferase class III-fold pyridoxal phosphate-dependent enzyme [Anaerolineae bacterium]
MNDQDIVQLNRQYTFFSWSVQSAVNPLPFDRGEGVYFWDTSGKKYLDFSSQLVNLNIGHQHPKVVQAIQDQAARCCFVQPGYATEPRGLLGKSLAEVTPGNLSKVFFCLGGAEANENAIKIARMYTKRSKIVARYRSYHGATHGAIALTGDPRRWAAEPTMPGVVRIFDPYCYRCTFGLTPDTCRRQCVTHIEDVIRFEGPDNIAAIFMEGVTGTNGLIVPPDDYWPRVRELCDRYGILLVSDEVMSGFGRTGKWFAVDHWNVAPDMITMAKGLTAGYVPLAAVVVSEPIAEYFQDRMLSCGLTYSSHPLGCAAGVATLAVYEEEGLIENAARLGQILGQCLEEIKARHPSVGDVRYIGLFSAIELVKNRETKEPMPSAILSQALRERGLSTLLLGNLVTVSPPLCITEEELRAGLDIIDEALDVADQNTV